MGAKLLYQTRLVTDLIRGNVLCFLAFYQLDQLLLTMHVQLLVHVSRMGMRRALRNAQLLGNGGNVAPASQKTHHLALARSQAPALGHTSDAGLESRFGFVRNGAGSGRGGSRMEQAAEHALGEEPRAPK